MEDVPVNKYMCIKNFIIKNEIVALKGMIYEFESGVLYSESLELFYKIRETKYSIPEWRFILHFERLDENRKRKIKNLLDESL